MTVTLPILSDPADAVSSRSDHGKWQRSATTRYQSDNKTINTEHRKENETLQSTG